MIKKLFVAVCILMTVLKSPAQYYYKDIVSNKQLLDEMAVLKDQGIRSVTITSLEDDGTPSESFLVEKNINRNYTSVETFTRSGVTGASLFTSSFTKDGLLIQTVDSSDLSVNTSRYVYDEQRRIKSIQSYIHSSDDDFKNELTEHHNYEYDANGKLVRMYRIKNNTDTTLILFSTDDKNNISIEKDTKSGKSYYYYYDAKNRLTDVVHLNPYNQRMLPDYVFEYNNAGQVTQMTTTEEGSSYYYIWKYTYSNGLRVKEKCYSKERQLLGTINYEYK
jgi:YD repeat-containing protein